MTEYELLLECELGYGEICYKCEIPIGDAIGEPRLCESCERDEKINEIIKQ